MTELLRVLGLPPRSSTPGPPAAQGEGAAAAASGASNAMAEWKRRHAAAVAALRAVAGRIVAARHPSSAAAVVEIQAVVKNLTPEPATLRQVDELQRWLAQDDVVSDVCELAEDIRTPLLQALAQLRGQLSA